MRSAIEMAGPTCAWPTSVPCAAVTWRRSSRPGTCTTAVTSRYRPQPLLPHPARRRHAALRPGGIRPRPGHLAGASARRSRPPEPLTAGSGDGSSEVPSMVIVFALLAALSNAVNEATQHVASIAAPRKSSGWQLVVYLFRNPLWLFGWIALAGAFVFQALALHDGQVSVVQPLLATELVFMLILRRVWIHQSIRPITWGATVVTCVSLTVFILAGQPGGGQHTPDSKHWLSAALACCVGAARSEEHTSE